MRTPLSLDPATPGDLDEMISHALRSLAGTEVNRRAHARNQPRACTQLVHHPRRACVATAPPPHGRCACARARVAVRCERCGQRALRACSVDNIASTVPTTSRHHGSRSARARRAGRAAHRVLRRAEVGSPTKRVQLMPSASVRLPVASGCARARRLPGGRTIDSSR